MRKLLDSQNTAFGPIEGIVYEDKQALVFKNTRPLKQLVRYLVIPKQKIIGLQDAKPEDKEMLGHLLLVANTVAEEQGFGENYRMVLNVGKAAGQTVFHLHFHMITGHDPLDGF
jgi:histidine triad (HIT) family protein